MELEVQRQERQRQRLKLVISKLQKKAWQRTLRTIILLPSRGEGERELKAELGRLRLAKSEALIVQKHKDGPSFIMDTFEVCLVGF